MSRLLVWTCVPEVIKVRKEMKGNINSQIPVIFWKEIDVMEDEALKVRVQIEGLLEPDVHEFCPVKLDIWNLFHYKYCVVD